MPTMEATRSLDGVRVALGRKGFESLGVTRYDGTLCVRVVLHDDHRRLARGDGARIVRAILAAEGLDGQWSDPVRAGSTVHPMTERS